MIMACALLSIIIIFYWKGPEYAKGVGSQTSPTYDVSE